MVHLSFGKSWRCAIAGILTLGLAACQAGQSQPLRPEPLPQDESIQVYTNHEPASSYTEPYRQQIRDGDDLEQILVATIASAEHTVDVAVQELRLPKVAAALVERQQAGVQVRVVLENTYSRPFSQFTPEEVNRLPDRERSRYQEFRELVDLDQDGQLSATEITQGDALVMLDRAKVSRIDDTADGSAGSNLMHHKFLVVDDRIVIVTSANWTTSDVHGDFKTPSSQGNANNLLKITSPELAQVFTQEFNVMWGDGPGGKPNSRFGVKKPFRPARSLMVGQTQVEVQFSPSSRTVPWEQTSNGLIGKTLATGKQSIELALFVFSDQQLVNQLAPNHRQETEIRALIDPQFAYRSYSEALDMLGIVLAENCQLEPDNAPWQPAIATVGVPRMPPGDLLHHKFGIIDRQTVITGSHNWTEAANTGNDETVLVIHNPVVAAHYQREFERLYANAILGVPPTIRQQAEAQKRQCAKLQAAAAKAPSVTVTTRQSAPAVTPQPLATKPTRAAKPTVAPAKRPTQSTLRVNLNTATQAELEALPGVGPSLAKRIIAARQRQQFRSLADLDRVSGVGPKLLKKLQDHITW